MSGTLGPGARSATSPKRGAITSTGRRPCGVAKGVASGKIKSNSQQGEMEQGSQSPGVGSQLCLTLGQDLKFSEPSSSTVFTWQSS